MVNLKKIIAAAASLCIACVSFNLVFAADEGDSAEVIVGGYNFDNFTDYIGERFLQAKEEQTLDLEGGVQVALGARSDGANGNTGWYSSEIDAEHGSSGQANLGQYVTSARGPLVKFNIESNVTAGKRVGMRFEYYPVNGTGNTADLILYDASAALQIAYLTVGQELIENAWNSIELMVETSGSTTLIVNNNIIDSSDMTPSTYPQIKFTEVASDKDLQSRGNIDNIELYTGGKLTDEQLLNIYASNIVIDTEQNTVNESADGNAYDVYGNFSLPSSTDVQIEWRVEQRLKDTDDQWEQSQYVSIAGRNLTISDINEASKYDTRLVAIISYNEASMEKYFSLNLKSEMTALQEYADSMQIKDAITGTDLTPGEDNIYRIDSDISLDNGNELINVNWACYKEETVVETDENNEQVERTEWVESSIIDANGEFYPTDYVGTLKLTATLSFNSTELTKDYFVASTVNAVTDYIDPTINGIVVTSADDTTVVYEDAKNIGIVNRDLQFPTSVKVADGDVEIVWEVISGEEYASIDKNGLLTIMTSDNSAHEVEMKATFTYVKNSKDIISKTEEGYKFSIQFTEDDANSDDAALDKYKVRFDAANEDQFDIPSSTSSDIELITEGEFGSSIKWTSNAPTIISNSGDFTRPSTNRNVTLTASIMSGAFSETKTFEVTARARSTSSGSGGGGGGGSTSSTGSTSNIDTSGTIAQANPGTITTPQSSQEIVDELIQQREEAENRFTDIGGVSWARDAINGLYDAGIINGKTETTFAPNDNVTRAEFAKMLMGVFGLTSSGFTTSSFYDVPTDAWYFQSVESAYNLGIINGVSAGYFDPDANITRQDMAVMVMRAATVAGQSVTAVEEAITFADDASIADYAKEAVSTLQAAGVINGVSDTEFAPTSNATRAQAAQILYSFL